LIGQYAHGNEPSHHMAYLYCYVNQPWKTQKLVRRILDTLYTDKPDGLSGNEDCGQMSAWYIMSAMGFYPVTPGQDTYVIGTPLFKRTVIDVGNGKTFTISAANVSTKNIYIQSARLNRQPWTKSWIRHGDIVKGGTLEFQMGQEPNKQWGSRDEDIPFSAVTEHPMVPVPYVVSGSRTFTDSTEVALGALVPGSYIYYTLDESAPTTGSHRYEKPFIVDRSVTVKAIAVKKGLPASMVMTSRFAKIPGGRSIRLKTRYAPQYAAGGDMALIDGIRGSGDFKTGTWQGYEGVNLEAVVDLGKTKTIRKLSIGFLQDNNSWIFMPERVEFYVSSDGKTFELAAKVENDISHRREGSILKEFTATITASARYVKVIGKNIGV
ncbi:MAG: glycoside hydrolase family 92 protein, partial [bacterium]|nr:glycoside hydrolase family 92 protein [bacterium]